MEENQRSFDVIDDKRSLIIILSMVFIINTVSCLDSSMVNICVPTIARSFGVSIEDGALITIMYILGLSCLLIFFMKVCESGYLRKMFFIGVVVFATMSFFCSISTQLYEMSVFRFFQGIGSCMMMAISPVIIIRIIPSTMRGLGIAVSVVASNIAQIAGGPLGGVIDAAVGWTWIFLINVPLCIILAIIGYRFLPKATKTMEIPDLKSSSYLCAFTLTSLIGIQTMLAIGFNIFSITMCLISLMFIALLVHRLRSNIERPILNISIFHNREFLILMACLLITTFVAMGINTLLPYYLQVGWKMDVLTSSLFIALISVIAIPVSLFVGKWCDTKGCKTPASLSVVIRIAICLAFIAIDPSTSLVVIGIMMLMIGTSYGMSGTSQTTRIIHHSSFDQKIDADALESTSSLYVSSLATVVFTGIMTIAIGTDVPISSITSEMMIEGFRYSMIFAAIICAIALVCSLVVRNIVPSKDEKNK